MEKTNFTTKMQNITNLRKKSLEGIIFGSDDDKEILEKYLDEAAQNYNIAITESDKSYYSGVIAALKNVLSIKYPDQ